MKKFFKYVPVALGLMALASCSNDEFESQVAPVQKAGAGDIVVENEVLEWEGEGSTTRSYLSRDLKVRMYTTDDEMKVFDDNLNKYDLYAFSWNDPSTQTTGTFRRFNTASNLDAEPKWAIYPSVDDPTEQFGKWFYNKLTNNTEVQLTSTLQPTYAPDGTYQRSDTKFENPLYKDILPRWGKVAATGEGSALQTSLSYLTGVLRLQLNGAPDYADYVTVQLKDGSNYLKINGQFTTTLAINDVMQTAQFAAGPSQVFGDDVVTINIQNSGDLKGIDAKKSVVFVPLPVTDHAVDIEVKYFKLPSLTPVKEETFKDKTILRAKVYGHKAAVNFALDGTNTSSLNDAIELAEVAEDEALVIEASQTITVDPTTGENVIYIPNKKCKEIIVKLSKDIQGMSAGDKLFVKYKDIDGEGKFKGNVTIVGGTTASNSLDLNVLLDETPFTLVNNNNFGTAVNVDATEMVIDGANAYTEAKLKLSDNVKKLTVANDASIDKLTVKTNYKKLEEVNVLGTVSGVIDATDIDTDVNASGTGTLANNVITKGDISISDNATFNNALLTSQAGDIDIEVNSFTMVPGATFTATLGSISIKSTIASTQPNDITAGKDVTLAGEVAVSGAITAGQDFSIANKCTAANVDVKRDATINIEDEAVAVSETLKYNGAGKLNLFNGYVNTVDANNKAVGLYHGEKAGFTAIAVTSNDAKLAAKNASIWNGVQMKAALAPTYRKTTAGEIWTASQLGYALTLAPDFKLKSDIDLDNKDWKGIEHTGATVVEGNNYTISNINLVGVANGSNISAGFIAYANGAVTMSNINFSGVKTTMLELGKNLSGVGAIIGEAKATATLSNVNVKLATGYFGSMDGMKNIGANCIGGAIGHATGDATFKAVNVDINGAILAGHYGLGGFIGKADAKVEILTRPELGTTPKLTSGVTGLNKFEVTKVDLGSYDNDTKQGMTGYYIGTVNLGSSSNIITIEEAANVAPTFTVSRANLNVAFSVTGAKAYYYSQADQTLIGQSGFTSAWTVAKPTINGKVYQVYQSDAASIPVNQLYKVTVSTYQP